MANGRCGNGDGLDEGVDAEERKELLRAAVIPQANQQRRLTAPSTAQWTDLNTSDASNTERPDVSAGSLASSGWSYRINEDNPDPQIENEQPGAGAVQLNYLMLQNRLAEFQRDVGLYGLAEQRYLKLSGMLNDQSPEVDHRRAALATVFNNLSVLYTTTGRYAERIRKDC